MSETKKASRRDFLKGSATVVAGTALAASLNVGRFAHAAGSDVIKVCLVAPADAAREPSATASMPTLA